MPTRIYRNDSTEVLDVPGLGFVGPGQRVSVSGEFTPPIIIENHPGLVDVHAEEALGIKKDYEAEPEPAFDEPAHREKVEEANRLANEKAVAEKAATQTPSAPEEVQSNG